MKAKKVYFLLSAGWGPVVRALPVANALKKRGVRTYFHVSGSATIEAMARFGHEHVSPKSAPQKGTPKRNWWTLDQLLFDFGWSDSTFVENRFEAYREAIESVKPDVLVVDFNTAAMLVARTMHIPTVAIVQSCFHPMRPYPYIVWWKSPQEPLPNVTDTLNSILVSHGAEAITRAEELQTGDETIIPSFPEFDPLKQEGKPARYVGPILGNEDVSESKKTKKCINGGEAAVVVYPGRPKDMGGESGNLILRTVIPVLERLAIPSVISYGAFNYPDYASERGNIKFASWVALRTYASQRTILIHHGGHGACLSGVLLAMPSLVIPTFAEREYNARHLEKIGCGISLPPEKLSEKTVENELSRLKTPMFLERANFWKTEIERRGYGGAEEVIRIISTLL